MESAGITMARPPSPRPYVAYPLTPVAPLFGTAGGGGWRGEDAAVQRGAALAIVSYSQSSVALHDLGPEGIPRVKVVPTVNESGDLEVPLFDVVSLATAHHVVVRTLGFAPGTRMVGVS